MRETMTIQYAVDVLVLLSLLAAVVVWPTQWISDRSYFRLRLAAVSLVALQLIVDGPRLQLIPAYCVALLFAALLILNRHDANEPSAIRERNESMAKKRLRWAMAAGSGVAVLCSVALCVLYPRM